MLGLLERTRAQIRGFIEQRDDLIAVAVLSVTPTRRSF